MEINRVSPSRSQILVIELVQYIHASILNDLAPQYLVLSLLPRVDGMKTEAWRGWGPAVAGELVKDVVMADLAIPTVESDPVGFESIYPVVVGIALVKGYYRLDDVLLTKILINLGVVA